MDDLRIRNMVKNDGWKNLFTGLCKTTGGAKDLFLDYEKMPNEKKYFIRLPKKNPIPGDVLIWDSSISNMYGHVAICLGTLGSSFIVFEQDGFKQDGAKLVERNSASVIGILRYRGIK